MEVNQYMNMFDLDTRQILSLIGVTVIILILDLILSFIVKKVFDVLFAGIIRRSQSERSISRTYTLKHLFQNIAHFVIFLLALLIILSQWGIDIIPILTGAGILGLAFSFGAQTFIKDLISGMFIVLEDQFHIGDHIKVGDSDGVVRSISLRLTVLEDKKGNNIYIPNSQITTLIKFKRSKKP